MIKKEICLEINGREVVFSIDLATHNTFVNGYNAVNKVQPSHNFVMACCSDEGKDFVRELLKGDGGGGLAVELAGMLNVEYSPQVSVIVKKPTSMPSA
jgi:hypothetical protein